MGSGPISIISGDSTRGAASGDIIISTGNAGSPGSVILKGGEGRRKEAGAVVIAGGNNTAELRDANSKPGSGGKTDSTPKFFHSFYVWYQRTDG